MIPSKTINRIFVSMCLVFICLQMVQAQSEIRQPEKFGAVSCEEELAILDSFAYKLKSDPFITAYFFIYGGKSDTKSDEIQIRGARMKRYLAENRGIETQRIKIISAGFREKFTIEVWFVAIGENAPQPTPTISKEEIQFKEGEFPNREEPSCYSNLCKSVKS